MKEIELNLIKYLVKLTKYKDRCTITIPTKLVKDRDLLKYDYILITDTHKEKIEIRGIYVEDII